MVERNSLIEMTQEKPCRACTDFKSWVKQQKQAYSAQTTNGKDEDNQSKKSLTNQRTDCPLTRSEVGRKTWAVLHTVAAYYPDQPTEEQKSDMKNLFYILSKFYPCSYCAEDFREQLKNNPPQTSSQMELSQWLCRIHNEVNVKIGKPEFDCKLVNQRWRDGWLDGSCD